MTQLGRFTLCTLGVVAASALAWSFALAQETFSEGSDRNTLDPTEIRNLDDIRELTKSTESDSNDARRVSRTTVRNVVGNVVRKNKNYRHTGSPVGLAGPSTLSVSASHPRLEAQQQLNQLKKQLGDNPDSETKEKVRDALMKYFVADMAQRVKELDEIKARTKKMEEQLERRIRSKEKVVNLQLEVLLNEAAGLGFYSADQHRNAVWSNVRTNAATGISPTPTWNTHKSSNADYNATDVPDQSADVSTK